MFRSVMTMFALCASAASATPDVARCAGLQDPNDRLNCYDAAFREVTVPEVDSEWNVRVSRSQLDDSTTVIARVESTQPVRGRFGAMETGTLIIRCAENTTSLYIVFGGHFMADIQGRGRIDYRVDNKPPRNTNFRVSNDNQALGLWRGNASIPFIREIMDGQSLFVRATPFSESAVEMTFPIAGLADAITPLRQACNW